MTLASKFQSSARLDTATNRFLIFLARSNIRLLTFPRLGNLPSLESCFASSATRGSPAAVACTTSHFQASAVLFRRITGANHGGSLHSMAPASLLARLVVVRGGPMDPGLYRSAEADGLFWSRLLVDGLCCWDRPLVRRLEMTSFLVETGVGSRIIDYILVGNSTKALVRKHETVFTVEIGSDG
jgi:hypothetical protein